MLQYSRSNIDGLYASSGIKKIAKISAVTIEYCINRYNK